jgi:hypothetical protein
MGDTYGLREEDFKTQWPNRLAVLLTVVADVQTQSRLMLEYAAANSAAGVSGMVDARETLAGLAVEIAQEIRSSHAASCEELVRSQREFAGRFKLFQEEYFKRMKQLEGKEVALARTRRIFEQQRAHFKSLSRWRRVWLVAISGDIPIQ